jgi:moderate conductance mechanosensitive channel
MRISPTIIRISIWIAFGLTLATGAMAQAGDKNNIVVILRPGLEKGQIETALDAARGTGRPVTVRWEDPAPVTSSAPAAAPSHGLWDAFEDDLALHLQGLMRLPDLPRTVAAAWARDANAGSLPLLAAMLAIAALFAFGIHRWLYAVLPRSTDLPADAIGRLRVSASRLLIDLAALGAFGLGGWLLLRWLLPAPDMAHVLGVHLIRYGSTAALFWIAGRFLLAPRDPESRLLPLPNAAWHFRMLATYGVLGAVVQFAASLARQVGGDPAAIEGWSLLGGTIITVFKIAWFWGGRHDIAAFFRGDFSGSEPGLIRRAAAASLPYLLIGVALAIWFAGNVAAADPQRGHWGTVAGATQVLVILLPIAALGIDALSKSLIARQLAQSSTPLRAATAATVRAAIAGGVWVVGLYGIVRMWDLFLPYPSSQAALAATVRIGAALVTGWAIWSFLSVYFEAHMPKPRSGQPGDEDEGEPLVQTRLTTVLPIVRDLSFGATIAITALIVLSAVGVDIGPLLAGFGIVGLAISFGSQALVKDIVSGIFFMTDDAFRVGEYIDTGKLKGTVERITLRSVQLRHQNGPVHTIPFGTIGQITNFSRDWATMKFTIRLDRDADIEKARKTIKKLSSSSMVGQQMAVSFGIKLDDSLVNGAVEVIRAGERLMGEVMPLQVAPDPFDVVQLRGVFRQPLDREPVGTLREGGA